MEYKQSQSTSFRSYGYTCLGPILYGFASWVGETATEAKVDHLYFLARDGYIVEKAYNLLKPINLQWPTASYLYASRRSLYGPLLLTTRSFEDMLAIISDRSSWTPRQFVEAVGLTVDYIPSWVDQSLVVYRSDVLRSETFRRLFSDLLPNILEQSRKEYAALKLYLQQEGLLTGEPGKFGLVDIGWNGSMQKYLKRELNYMSDKLEPQLFGMYLGLTEKSSVLGDSADAFWFNDSKSDGKSRDIVAPFKGLLELFFSNAEESVNYFDTVRVEQGIKAIPILSKIDSEVNNDSNIQQSKLMEIRSGALCYVKDQLRNRAPMQTPKQSMKKFLRLALRPTLQETRVFGNFSFDDGGKCKLASPRRLYTYIVHPSALKVDLLASRWKIGFLKRLIRFPLNYNKLYIFLQTLSRMR
ncbi:MAG: hypothetical protein LKF99_05425 [Bifidobacterium sp.]|nr:hypothetical protein [Bifidobacterium sp.]